MKLTEKTKTELREFVENILVPHTAFSCALERLEQGIRVAPIIRDPLGYFISGESRTGKSRLIEEFTNRYPPYRTPEGMRIPVLYVEVPSNPTEKGLAAEILAALGDPLADKGTENEKKRRLLRLLKECKTLVLILDEFQHFVDKTANNAVHLKTSDWLKGVLNQAKVVTVIAGLPYGNSVLAQNQQLRGRITQDIHMPRFDWKNDSSRGEFLGLLDGFTDVLRSRFTLPDLGEDTMAYRIYLASGGITGILTNLIRQAAWNAIDANRTDIKLEDLSKAYKQAIHSLDHQAVNPFSLDPKVYGGEALERAYQIGIGSRIDGYPAAQTRRGRKPNSQTPINGCLSEEKHR